MAVFYDHYGASPGPGSARPVRPVRRRRRGGCACLTRRRPLLRVSAGGAHRAAPGWSASAAAAAVVATLRRRRRSCGASVGRTGPRARRSRRAPTGRRELAGPPDRVPIMLSVDGQHPSRGPAAHSTRPQPESGAMARTARYDALRPSSSRPLRDDTWPRVPGLPRPARAAGPVRGLSRCSADIDGIGTVDRTLGNDDDSSDLDAPDRRRGRADQPHPAQRRRLPRPRRAAAQPLRRTRRMSGHSKHRTSFSRAASEPSQAARRVLHDPRPTRHMPLFPRSRARKGWISNACSSRIEA